MQQSAFQNGGAIKTQLFLIWYHCRTYKWWSLHKYCGQTTNLAMNSLKDKLEREIQLCPFNCPQGKILVLQGKQTPSLPLALISHSE